MKPYKWVCMFNQIIWSACNYYVEMYFTRKSSTSMLFTHAWVWNILIFLFLHRKKSFGGDRSGSEKDGNAVNDQHALSPFLCCDSYSSFQPEPGMLLAGSTKECFGQGCCWYSPRVRFMSKGIIIKISP